MPEEAAGAASPRDARHRAFLFLQGPQGPFFWLLGQALRARGAAVYRINLNGGDRADWPGEAFDFRGRAGRWPSRFGSFLEQNGITDVLLFGDCRPLHRAAHGIAKLYGVNIHVFEEGYIRPDWMTMEPDGVNGHSALSRDPTWLIEQARFLPPVPVLPTITADFKRRARDSMRYFTHVALGRMRFPFYRSHRPVNYYWEGIGWLRKFALRKRRAVQAAQGLASLEGRRFFLFPLQLGTDYQIRTHSPFADMASAAEYVIANFARHAPTGVMLLIKEHPLDSSFFNWRAFVAKQARKYGIEGRIAHIDGGDLDDLTTRSLGMVTVNSTSGTLALSAGAAVFVLGSAIYDIPGITHQGKLDTFWKAPVAPKHDVYEAFRRVLHDRCLVRGGLASESAVAVLVESAAGRLLGEA